MKTLIIAIIMITAGLGLKAQNAATSLSNSLKDNASGNTNEVKKKSLFPVVGTKFKNAGESIWYSL